MNELSLQDSAVPLRLGEGKVNLPGQYSLPYAGSQAFAGSAGVVLLPATPLELAIRPAPNYLLSKGDRRRRCDGFLRLLGSSLQ